MTVGNDELFQLWVACRQNKGAEETEMGKEQVKATHRRPKMKVESIKCTSMTKETGGWGDGVRRMNMWEGAGREIFALCH